MAGSSSSAVVSTNVSSQSEAQARILKKTLIPRTVYRGVAAESLRSRCGVAESPRSRLVAVVSLRRHLPRRGDVPRTAVTRKAPVSKH